AVGRIVPIQFELQSKPIPRPKRYDGLAATQRTRHRSNGSRINPEQLQVLTHSPHPVLPSVNSPAHVIAFTMAQDLWVLGVALSLTATLFGTLGKVLLKLAHTSSQTYTIKLAATLCVFVLNPVFDALSYAYAAQSILAPMAGFSVVWNIVLSPYVLKEKLSIHDIKGTALILVGCVMVGISGSHATPTHHSDEIYALFSGSTFMRYAVAAISAAVWLVWIIYTFDRTDGWRRFAYGALSGLVGGNLFFLKASVELLAEGGHIWSCVETYLIFAGALASAGGGIYVLDLGLREYDALYLVAIYQTFLIIIGSISGVIFFHENSDMQSWWQALVYPVSIITTVAGVVILSDKHQEHETSAAEEKLLSGHEETPLVVSGSSVNHGAISSSLHLLDYHSMTTIFDGYDEEYRALASDISKKISEVATYEDEREKKKTSLQHIGDLLTQANQLIQQMELEVRSLDAATRRELSKKVDQYKKSLASLGEDHKKIKEKEEREGLFGDRDAMAMSSADQRNRMKAATEKMKGTTDKIEAARRTVAETEEVALAITDELGRNREKIAAAHSKVKSVNEMARRGDSIVGRMSARDKRQRTALMAAAGFIGIAILLVIYFGIFKRK
ncbi:TPA: hypothetical protein N0F65_007237, partial [Lagenidium giganteum]